MYIFMYSKKFYVPFELNLVDIKMSASDIKKNERSYAQLARQRVCLYGVCSDTNSIGSRVNYNGCCLEGDEFQGQEQLKR